MAKSKIENLFVVYVEDDKLYQVAFTIEQKILFEKYLSIILEKKLTLHEEPICKCNIVTGNININ